MIIPPGTYAIARLEGEEVGQVRVGADSLEVLSGWCPYTEAKPFGLWLEYTRLFELRPTSPIAEAVRAGLLEHLPGKHDQDKHASGGGAERGDFGELEPADWPQQPPMGQSDPKWRNKPPDTIKAADTLADLAGAQIKRSLKEGDADVNGVDMRDMDDALVKHALVKDLAAESGVDYETVNQVVHQWAESSNDTSLASLSMQQAVSEELGAPFHPWQAEQMKAALAQDATARAAFDKGFAMRQSTMPGGRINFKKLDQMEAKARDLEEQERQLWKDYSLADEAGRAALHLKITEVRSTHQGMMGDRSLFEADHPTPPSRAVERKVVRAMYENTQRKLKEAGIESVTLTRGVRGETKGKKGDDFDFRASSASSFTTEPSTAHQFGRRLATKVPRERILSTYCTGFGCRSESEWVVLGGPGKARWVD